MDRLVRSLDNKGDNEISQYSEKASIIALLKVLRQLLRKLCSAFRYFSLISRLGFDNEEVKFKYIYIDNS